MHRYLLAALWATAMLGMALVARLGWIDQGAATSMLMLMPLLAWVTIQGQCRRPAREG